MRISYCERISPFPLKELDATLRSSTQPKGWSLTNFGTRFDNSNVLTLADSLHQIFQLPLHLAEDPNSLRIRQ